MKLRGHLVEGAARSSGGSLGVAPGRRAGSVGEDLPPPSGKSLFSICSLIEGCSQRSIYPRKRLRNCREGGLLPPDDICAALLQRGKGIRCWKLAHTSAHSCGMRRPGAAAARPGAGARPAAPSLPRSGRAVEKLSPGGG